MMGSRMLVNSVERIMYVILFVQMIQIVIHINVI